MKRRSVKNYKVTSQLHEISWSLDAWSSNREVKSASKKFKELRTDLWQIRWSLQHDLRIFPCNSFQWIFLSSEFFSIIALSLFFFSQRQAKNKKGAWRRAQKVYKKIWIHFQPRGDLNLKHCLFQIEGKPWISLIPVLPDLSNKSQKVWK